MLVIRGTTKTINLADALKWRPYSRAGLSTYVLVCLHGLRTTHLRIRYLTEIKKSIHTYTHTQTQHTYTRTPMPYDGCPMAFVLRLC